MYDDHGLLASDTRHLVGGYQHFRKHTTSISTLKKDMISSKITVTTNNTTWHQKLEAFDIHFHCC